MGKLRKVLIIALAVIFAGSVGMFAYRNIQYGEGEDTYSEAVELAGVPDLTGVEEQAETEQDETEVYVDPYADLLRNMDFTALRDVNSDVLGWILIPDTVVSYPVVRTDDNDYYLKHDYKKDYSAVGAIFMEKACSTDFTDFNTIIYGHRMNNGSMFGALKYYKSSSYWKSHPYVYVTTDAGCMRYDVFAAYEVSTAGDTYQIGIKSDTKKQAFIDYCISQSLYDTGVVPDTNDRILTLSTCTGNGHATRWVVQAVLKIETPSAAEPAEPPATEPADSGDGAATDSTTQDDVPASTDGSMTNIEETETAENADETQTADNAENGASQSGTSESGEQKS